ncbi:HWE histidine kinase domain-containing protein, partial [Sphingobium yanoikuyae]
KDHRLLGCRLRAAGYALRSSPAPQQPILTLIVAGFSSCLSRGSRRVLNDELNHRVKNIITLIKSIAVQTGAHAETVEDYTSSFEGRLRALAFAHDQSLSATVGGDLAVLIEAEAGLHRYGPGAERVLASGDKVRLNDRAFGVLALVIHELMTNAAKYGALSVPEGRLDISWTYNETDGCEIRWTESGGPRTKAPKRQGFGSKLIQTTMVYDLGGRADLTFPPTGMTASLVIPARFVSLADEADEGTAAHSDPSKQGSLDGLSLLLVEDQSLIALDTEDLLRRLGAKDVRLSPDATHALLTLGSFRPDAAVLDFNLGEETSEKIADHLVALGIPFVFSTGYGDNVLIPERLRGIPVVRKPASLKTMASQLIEARRAISS